MAGYIGSKASVTQVDGYNRTEADDRYVNAAGDTMTGTLSVTGVDRNEDALRVGASSAGTGYGLRIGASGATDPLEIWREHSSGDQMQLSVDYYGRVTMPYQPAFSATGASGGNVSVSNPTALSLQSTHFNRGNHYNTSTSKFTAPVSGIYQFNIVTYLNSDTATVVFLVNDAQIGSADTDNLLFKTTASPYTMAMSICATLAANDTVSVSSRAGSGSTTFYIGHTTFSGYLIG